MNVDSNDVDKDDSLTCLTKVPFTEVCWACPVADVCRSGEAFSGGDLARANCVRIALTGSEEDAKALIEAAGA